MVLLSQAQKGTTTPSYACAIWRACLPPRETGIRVQQLRAAQAGLSSGGGHPGVPGTWLHGPGRPSSRRINSSCHLCPALLSGLLAWLLPLGLPC